MNSNFKSLNVTWDEVREVQLEACRLVDRLNVHKDKLIHISETLCVGDNFDRHFTTTSDFQMVLGSVGILFSGLRMLITSADEKAAYEISHGDIYKIETTDNGYYIMQSRLLGDRCLGRFFYYIYKSIFHGGIGLWVRVLIVNALNAVMNSVQI